MTLENIELRIRMDRMQPRKEWPKFKTRAQALKKSRKLGSNLGGISVESVAKHRESSDLNRALDFDRINGWSIEKSRTVENKKTA